MIQITSSIVSYSFDHFKLIHCVLLIAQLTITEARKHMLCAAGAHISFSTCRQGTHGPDCSSYYRQEFLTTTELERICMVTLLVRAWAYMLRILRAPFTRSWVRAVNVRKEKRLFVVYDVTGNLLIWCSKSLREDIIHRRSRVHILQDQLHDVFYVAAEADIWL
jgi:hypothetical protein